jgi:hypothetical protein
MNWKIALSALVIVAAVPAVSLVSLASLAGCGSDECTQASDFLAACAPPNATTSSSSGGAAMTPACSGVTLCQSQCINQATCTEIAGNAPTFTECLVGCKGK